jgi:hypothetical protein
MRTLSNSLKDQKVIGSEDVNIGKSLVLNGPEKGSRSILGKTLITTGT